MVWLETRGPRRLIINADDFGLTDGVNRAVLELFEAGALSSATAMAGGGAFQGIPSSLAGRSIGVGCHVVLVDGRPLLDPALVPSLVERSGQFRTSLPAFVAALQTGRISEQEIEAEAEAQIRRLQDAGVSVTHVDTHKHTHLFPRVARPLLRAAARCGIHAIRNPFEDAWSARLSRGPLLRKLEVTLLKTFRSTFSKLVRASGLRTTEGSIGVSATGSLDEQSLKDLLDAMPPGTWELVCHPGYNDSDLARVRTRLRDTRVVERNALLALVPQAVLSGQFDLVSFRDL